MYTTFYKLKHKPFQISTDPKFLWFGEKHKEALSTLKYGVLDNKGFLLLTGDVGTGKTTLINALLKTLDDTILVATIRDPGLELIDFYNYTAHVFGMAPDFTNKTSFLIQFERFLYDAHEAGKQVLLIIDEAQRISQDLLEEVRLLSNIEKEDTKLLNIFFIGQLEFNHLLLKPENMSIRQRITVNYNLEPLTFPETARYIQHRLKIAGATSTIFDGSALGRIFSFSKGYPRLINILCDRSLLTGFVEEIDSITTKHVNECIKELEIPHPKHPEKLALNTAQKKEQDVIAQSANPKSGEQESKVPAGKTAAGKFLYATGVLFILLASYFIFSGKSIQGTIHHLQSTFFPDVPLPATEDRLAKKKTANKIIQPQQKIIEKELDTVIQPNVREKTETQQTTGTTDIQKNVGTVDSKTQEQQEQQVTFEKLVIPFPSNSNLPPKNYLKKLDNFAESLMRQKDYWIIVNGFTDSSGYESLNGKLSEFRANVIKIYLVGKGLEESRITTHGFGSQFPIAPNDSHEGRIANRRVEIELKK